MLTGTLMATGMALASCSLSPIVPADDVAAVCSLITQTCTLTPQASPADDATDEPAEHALTEIARLTLYVVPETEENRSTGLRVWVEQACDTPSFWLVPLDEEIDGPAYRLIFPWQDEIGAEFKATFILGLDGWIPSITSGVELLREDAETTASCNPQCTADCIGPNCGTLVETECTQPCLG